ncbi:MAG: aminopeptidase P family protein [Kiritimatiellae bacterium]|nr:aminopeptidase P family protein [Kiritimatiellia bacterium]
MFTDYPAELLEDLQARWRKVADALSGRSSGAALLVTSRVNLFYLSGRVYRGYAYLPAEGEPLFLVRRPLGLEGRNVRYFHRADEIPAILAEAGYPPPSELLLEDAEISHLEYLGTGKVFGEATLSAVSGSALLRDLRAVKSPYEISQIEYNGRKQAEGFAHFAELYRPGMTDQDFNIAIFEYMMRAGSLGIIRSYGLTMEGFIGQVLVGENGGGMSPYDYALGGTGFSRALPVGQCGAVIQPGDTVQCDIPGNFNGYICDSTRTYYRGQLSAKARDAHQCSIDILDAVAEAAVPGASCEALYQMSLRMAEAAGFVDVFMGGRQKARFVGHGTGLYVNESPVLGVRSHDILQEGMVIAVEPKFVIPGAGAVGCEDTFAVTPKGARCLSESPRGLMPLPE